MHGREINTEVVQERKELALTQYMLGENNYEGCSFYIGFSAIWLFLKTEILAACF